MTKQLKKLKNKKINIESGLYYCNESEDLYFEILDTVLEESPAKIELLTKWASLNDFVGYYREVHALKNVTATIGADQFNEYLSDLCTEMKTTNIFPSSAKVRGLMKQYIQLLKIIEKSKKS